MNLMFFIVLGSLLCVVVRAQETCENSVDCVLEHLKKKSEESLKTGQKSLDEMLKFQIPALKVTKDDSLESYLLHHQIATEKLLKSELKILNYNVGKLRLAIDEKRKDEENFRFTDCYDWLAAGNTTSGVYQISPVGCCNNLCTRPVEVYCDMSASGGGWTVFLSRKEVSEQTDFNRKWNDYRKGFGTAGEEYWLGNDILHSLTHHRSYILRMEAEDEDGSKIWGEWNNFKTGNENSSYNLHVTEPNSLNTAYDVFETDLKFTTSDVDNDKLENANCGDLSNSGWWFNECSGINPTGIYGRKDPKGLKFPHWSKENNEVKYPKDLVLMIRPKLFQN